jgi:hypothetical protein
MLRGTFLLILEDFFMFLLNGYFLLSWHFKITSMHRRQANQDEITIEGKWQTRVPSTLSLIQAKTTYLEDENGLPCCDPNAE